RGGAARLSEKAIDRPNRSLRQTGAACSGSGIHGSPRPRLLNGVVRPRRRAADSGLGWLDGMHTSRYADGMRRFQWIEWNLQKIAAHALSAEEVEAAFDRIVRLDERGDGSFRMLAEVPSGRRVWGSGGTTATRTKFPTCSGEVEGAPIFV